MIINWAPLIELVDAHESFVLTSHTRADCDAVGSELGMAGVLEALGKRVRIINADAPPPHIAFLDPAGKVEVLGHGATAADAHAADVHLVLDTSAWGQLGEMADVIRASPARKAVIDHHVSGDDLGAVVLKDTTAEATGRLVIEAAEALGVALTKPIADPLFCAIAPDTGWFRFPSVTEKTFAALAKLVAAGAEPSAAFNTLYEQNTAARVRLHGRVMERMATTHGGRVAYSAARESDFAETGALVSDTEDVVNRLLSVAGVEVAALLVWMDAQRTKVSLRSRGDFDVREVAEEFGGGGHTKAAGVRVPGTVDDAQRMILEALGRRLV
ncbi:MAG: bifunctional oligoribonuclease/PAP phosphatase NrnA [Planctomycetota bacterium]